MTIKLYTNELDKTNERNRTMLKITNISLYVGT